MDLYFRFNHRGQQELEVVDKQLENKKLIEKIGLVDKCEILAEIINWKWKLFFMVEQIMKIVVTVYKEIGKGFNLFMTILKVTSNMYGNLVTDFPPMLYGEPLEKME